jgi:hypothetical protein
MFGCEGGTTSTEDLTGCTIKPERRSLSCSNNPRKSCFTKDGLQIAAEARELTSHGHVEHKCPCLNEESGQPPERFSQTGEISGYELKLANAKSRGGIENWLGA